MEGVHLVETREGAKEWEVWADQAFGFKAENRWILDRVKAEIFGERGTRYTVTGSRGEINTLTKDLKVSGQVLTQSSNGYVFVTDEIVYSSKNRSLESQSQIEMKGPADEEGRRLTLTGKGMSLLMNSENMEILADVRGLRDTHSGDVVKIQSERAQLSNLNLSAIFQGKVLIERLDSKVFGPTAIFKFADRNNRLERIFVRGGVRIEEPPRWATSQTAQLDVGKNQIVLDGEPRVVQGADVLVGEQIIFHHDRDEIEVRSVRAQIQEPQR
jgi:LPS export ABC transporter protein LptC